MMTNSPSINILSTVTNGTLYGMVPNFFCNNVPSLLMGDQYGSHFYIVPLTSGLPQKLDINNLPLGTVTILPPPNGEIIPAVGNPVAINFKENGCDSILLSGTADTNGNDTYPIDEGIYVINGDQNFPTSFSVAEMLNSNQYGWIYQLTLHGTMGYGASTVTGGYFSSSTSHDVAICLVSNSWTAQSCSIIYHTADQFPAQINSSYVSSYNSVGLNLIANIPGLELNIPVASNLAGQGAFITFMNGEKINGTPSHQFSFISPIAQGDLSGDVLMSSIENKYAFNITYSEDMSTDDDRRESPNRFNYATGDFNNNGVLDLFIAFGPEPRGDVCLVGYMLYDLKNQFADINLNIQAQPIYDFAAGTCYSTTMNDIFATIPTSADVNGDGITDLLLTNMQTYNADDNVFSLASYAVFGSSSKLTSNFTLSEMSPAQGVNFNITSNTGGFSLNLAALGKIDQSGRDAFTINDENGVTHIVQLAGSSAEIVETI
jgi:hypothetical protein